MLWLIHHIRSYAIHDSEETHRNMTNSVKRLYRLSTCNNQIEIFPCHCVSFPSIHTLTCCTTTYERDNTKIRSTKYKKPWVFRLDSFFPLILLFKLLISILLSVFVPQHARLEMSEPILVCECVFFFSINSNSIHNEESNRTVNIWNMNIVRSRFPPFYPGLKRYLDSMYWIAIKTNFSH